MAAKSPLQEDRIGNEAEEGLFTYCVKFSDVPVSLHSLAAHVTLPLEFF